METKNQYKGKMTRTYATADGALYEGDRVTIQHTVDKLLKSKNQVRVKDSLGRIWFINRDDIVLL